MEGVSERRLVAELAAALGTRLGPAPEVAVVLGSGWKEAAPSFFEGGAEELPLRELPGWPLPRVAGHGSWILRGTAAGRSVALVAGRVHAYEGHAARVLVRGVRALRRWGVSRFVLCNAAGSLDPARPPGTFLVVEDHLNLQLPSPLTADQTLDGSAPFLDSQSVWDRAWRGAFRLRRPEVEAGVYAGMLGPAYETPAEIRFLAAAGAAAVGMSTIPEALALAAAGARILGLSLLTNLAAGVGGSRPDHEEVLAAGRSWAGRAAAVLGDALAAAPR